MEPTTKDNLTNRNIWVRGLYMLFFALAYAVAEAIVALVVVFQFIHTAFTGRVNPRLQPFGANLGAYIYDLLQYVTFNSENQPFPFADWPAVDTGTTPWSADAAVDPVETGDSPVEEPVEPSVDAQDNATGVAPTQDESDSNKQD